MKRVVIERGSPAFDELQAALADPGTWKVSLMAEEDGEVAIKTNEYGWTPPLSTGTTPRV